MAQTSHRSPTPRTATPRSASHTPPRHARATSVRTDQGGRPAPAREGLLSRLAARRKARAAAKAASRPQSSQVPFTATPKEVRRAQRQGGEEKNARNLRLPSLRAVAIAIAALVLTGLAATIALVVLSHTTLFTIESVIATSSEHVSEESLLRLARPESGTTLLNVDTEAITESVMRNPWVAEVHIDRSFPSTLRISVTERRVRALVVMGTGEVAWCLGDGGVWIEPIQVSSEEYENFADAALAKAQELGAVLVRDVPASVSPVAGAAVEDEALLAVIAYMEGFSDEFGEQVVSYSASSSASVGCTLASGVSVSLGEPTNIASKETVIAQLLEEHSGQITYINVRVPTNPSYRTIDSPSVQEGTGALGESGVDPEAAQQSEELAQAGKPDDPDNRIRPNSTSYSDEDDYDYDYDYDEDWY